MAVWQPPEQAAPPPIPEETRVEKEYVVVLKKDVDYDTFWDQIENASEDDGFVPSRRVDIVNDRPGSLRSCHYSLTDEEAEQLRNDPRVYGVEIPPDQRDDIQIGRRAIQEGTWRKTGSITSTDQNWGLIRGANSEDLWNQTTSINATFPYTLTGKGVDVVIQDGGVTVDHIEWLDERGESRYRSIDWYAASGLPGTQSVNHDRDINGHGSHCAGTVAGRTMGWAKDAHIYSLKVEGLESDFGSDGTGIPISDCMDVIKLWHRNKPVDPKTGFKRPTVVNMSWGFGGNRTTGTLSSGVYRGTPWTSGNAGYTSRLEQFRTAGIVPVSRINVRVASLDADLEELLDEGVHVCIAAGNSFFYIAAEGDQDWDNRANFGLGFSEYYHRGSSPYSTRAFMVGNLDITYQGGLEHKAESSCCGAGVDIYAPGTEIMSVASTDLLGTNEISDSGAPTIAASEGSPYKYMKISGTSMASPNVAGMIATVLEANPGMTPAQMKTFIHNNSTQNLLYDGTTDDWDDQDSIQGGPNRIFKTPFTSPTSIRTSNVNIRKK